MSLQPISLDTLNWDQISTAIRSRIPANSNGKWTLHAPVDPGVTLIELYAWLIEQRLYWMDQTPDDLIYASLALLGEAPKPALAAVTVMQLIDDAPAAPALRTVNGGTTLRLGQTNPALIFTTDNDVTLLPMDEGASAGLRINGSDQSADLQQGRPVSAIVPGAATAKIEFLFPLNAPLKGPASGTFSFLIDLEDLGGIAPQWSHFAADVPPPASLTWSYRGNSATGTSPFAAAQIADGTSGLRRPGIIELPIPGDWQAEPGAATAGAQIYSVVLTIANAQHPAPPRISRVVPNVVIARHRFARTKQPKNTDTWLPLPGNLIPLTSDVTGTALSEFPPIEDSIRVTIAEPDSTHTWSRANSLFNAGSQDRVFLANRQRGEVSFGDGLTGRLPRPSGPAAITVNYDAGGGAAGLVGENGEWNAIDPSNGGAAQNLRGLNVVAGIEGEESESLADAQLRVRASLKEIDRAVVADDFEVLARTTPGAGLARAEAAIGRHPDFPCTTVPGAVTVYVVPFAPRDGFGLFGGDADFVAAPVADPGQLSAVSQRLDGERLIGTQIFVEPAKYRRVSLTAQISASSAVSASLQAQMRARLQQFLDPLSGGDAGDGWPFGDPLRPTAFLRELQQVLGDRGSIQSVSIQLSGMPSPESCQDVAIGAYELPVLENVAFQVAMTSSRAGGLQ